MIPTYITVTTQWLTKQIDDKLNDIMHNTKNCQKTPLNTTYSLVIKKLYLYVNGHTRTFELRFSMYVNVSTTFFSTKAQYVGIYRTNRSTR